MEIIKFAIMSFMLGFSGNQIFNKKDKSLTTSGIVGAITGIILLVVDLLIICM